MKEIKNYYIAYNRGRIEERKRVLKIIKELEEQGYITFWFHRGKDGKKLLKLKLQEKTAK